MPVSRPSLFGPSPLASTRLDSGCSSHNFIDYGQVYWEAARTVGETISDGSLEALPAVNLYRQAIEIFIKGILRHPGNDLSPEEEQAVLRRKHRFAPQISDLRKAAVRASCSLSSGVIETLETWDADDEHGMKTRYPVSLKRKKGSNWRSERLSLTENGERFDFETFRVRAENALEELAEIARDLDPVFLREELGS